MFLYFSQALTCITGEYQRNLCTPGSPGCTPCPQRLFSCIGLPDGHNAIEGKQWTPDYITCHRNRTMSTDKCNQGVFDPNKRQCEIPPTSGPGTETNQLSIYIINLSNLFLFYCSRHGFLNYLINKNADVLFGKYPHSFVVITIIIVLKLGHFQTNYWTVIFCSNDTRPV